MSSNRDAALRHWRDYPELTSDEVGEIYGVRGSTVRAWRSRHGSPDEGVDAASTLPGYGDGIDHLDHLERLEHLLRAAIDDYNAMRAAGRWNQVTAQVRLIRDLMREIHALAADTDTDDTDTDEETSDEETFLRRQLARLHKDMERMRRAGQWQGLNTARRLALETRRAYDEMSAAREEDWDPHDLDKLAAEMVHLPEAVWAHPLIREACGLASTVPCEHEGRKGLVLDRK